MAQPPHDAPAKMTPNPRRGVQLLNIVSALMVVYLAVIGWQLAQHLDGVNLFLLCLFAICMLRVLYEITINRAKVPTIATGFFERGKIATRLKTHAAERAVQPYTVVDLGSGGGELTRRIGRTLPEAKVTGLEMSKFPYLRSSAYQRFFGPRNVEYRQQDFFSYDCSGADAVVMFLNRGLTQTVGEKLHKELKTGALVITNEFPMLGQWQPQEVVKLYTPFQATLFVYQKP